jgi:hypothetical protein
MTDLLAVGAELAITLASVATDPHRRQLPERHGRAIGAIAQATQPGDGSPNSFQRTRAPRRSLSAVAHLQARIEDEHTSRVPFGPRAFCRQP